MTQVKMYKKNKNLIRVTKKCREKFRGSECHKLRIGIFFDKVKAIYTKHIIVYIAWKNNFQKKFS